jgi:hypothetical protein
MEHRPLMLRWHDMRVLVLILAIATSACATAPPQSPESQTASACSQTTASALEVHTCGPDVDAVRDRRTGG